MEIIQINPANKKEAQSFLKLPFRIYTGIPQWVPPLASDANLMLDARRHPFYRHSEAVFFLCLQAGQPIARLAILNNKRYNQFNHAQAAFFTLFETENNPAAAAELFAAGGAWARARGLDEIIGPKGFTLLDGMGLLVKGFEHRPAFGLPYNPPYYPNLLTSLGFETQSEVVSGYLDPSMQLPPKLHEISRKIQERRGLHIAHFHTRRDLRSLIPHLKALYNGALEGTTGTYPLDDSDIDAMAAQLLWFADPKLIKIVMKNAVDSDQTDKPAGFLLAYPDISAALQKNKGRLFPFGWLTMLLELKRTNWININGAGMLEEYRGLGGTAILFSEMYKAISASGQFKHAEIVQIGVDNERMQRELRDLGVDFYKTHRVYRKDL